MNSFTNYINNKKKYIDKNNNINNSFNKFLNGEYNISNLNDYIGNYNINDNNNIVSDDNKLYYLQKFIKKKLKNNNYNLNLYEPLIFDDSYDYKVFNKSLRTDKYNDDEDIIIVSFNPKKIIQNNKIIKVPNEIRNSLGNDITKYTNLKIINIIKNFININHSEPEDYEYDFAIKLNISKYNNNNNNLLFEYADYVYLSDSLRVIYIEDRYFETLLYIILNFHKNTDDYNEEKIINIITDIKSYFKFYNQNNVLVHRFIITLKLYKNIMNEYEKLKKQYVILRMDKNSSQKNKDILIENMKYNKNIINISYYYINILSNTKYEPYYYTIFKFRNDVYNENDIVILGKINDIIDIFENFNYNITENIIVSKNKKRNYKL